VKIDIIEVAALITAMVFIFFIIDYAKFNQAEKIETLEAELLKCNRQENIIDATFRF
jgi:hypothetical protein